MQLNNENQIVTLKNGYRLGYAEYGDTNGKPLFFFHGWPSSRLQAKVLGDEAKKLQIHIISPDRPGYGLSDFDPNRILLDWPETVEELANALEIDSFSVLGVSGGGPYAAVCAYKIDSDRLKKTGIAAGLAPTNLEGVLQGMAFFNRLVWWSYHTFPITIQIAALIGFAQARKYIPASSAAAYPAKADQKLLSSKLRKEIQQVRAESFRQGKKAAAHDLKLYTKDWGFDLAKIAGEVLLWYGAEDKNVSLKMGEYFENKIPNSQLKVFVDDGHLLIINHASEIIKALVEV